MTDERKPLPAAPQTRSRDDGSTEQVAPPTGNAAIEAARARAAAQPPVDRGRAYAQNRENYERRDYVGDAKAVGLTIPKTKTSTPKRGKR